jgi:hypothetical protein
MCNPTNTTTTTTTATAAAKSDNDQEVQQGGPDAAHKVPLKPCDAWIEQLDLAAFASEIRALGVTLQDAQGIADYHHLQKMVRWSNTCALIGLVTMGLSVNLVTIAALSTWTCTRWTMIAHHTCHGGYDKVDLSKVGRWNRFRFAVGSTWRRISDWLDWMVPEAWNVEHNNRHHYNLSEVHDPDLVEANLTSLRDSPVPVFFKYVAVLFFMATWKWFYYAPNTYKELKLAALRKAGKPIPAGVKPEESMTVKNIVAGQNPFYSFTEFLVTVIGPYVVIRFLLSPLLMYLIGHYLHHYTGVKALDGATMYQNALINLMAAEIMTNMHGFLIVVTNHAGSDMYRFRTPCRPFSGSFYLRQVIASVNFNAGDDVTDFLHGWLNYQIEHHLWPNLSMLSYQRSAVAVKAICAKYGVPYIQEHVFVRLYKTVQIMVGQADMRWFPAEYEALFLQQDVAAQLALLEQNKQAKKQ